MIIRSKANHVRQTIKELLEMLDKYDNLFSGKDDDAVLTDWDVASKLRTKSHDLTRSLTKFRQIRMGQIDNQHRLKKYFKLLPDPSMTMNEEMIKKFFGYIFERQEIWYKRNILKKPAPWTKDPILKEYKFTNVYRELDRASQWLIRNVLIDEKNENTIEDILFKIIIFRFYNQPDTFTHKKYGVELQNWKGFDVEKMWKQSTIYRKEVSNCWHVSYMMNLAFLPMPNDWDVEKQGMFKDHAYIRHIFPKVHKIIPELKDMLKVAPNTEVGVKKVLDFLEKNIPAVSTFMSHEFYLDFCYVTTYFRQPICKWNLNTYTNCGPGASLGIRLMFPSLQTIKEQTQALHWLYEIAEEQLAEFGEFKYINWNKKKKEYEVFPGKFEGNYNLHIGEFSSCEFSKLAKIWWKEGKQRSKFIPDNNGWKL